MKKILFAFFLVIFTGFAFGSPPINTAKFKAMTAVNKAAYTPAHSINCPQEEQLLCQTTIALNASCVSSQFSEITTGQTKVHAAPQLVVNTEEKNKVKATAINDASSPGVDPPDIAVINDNDLIREISDAGANNATQLPSFVQLE